MEPLRHPRSAVLGSGRNGRLRVVGVRPRCLTPVVRVARGQGSMVVPLGRVVVQVPSGHRLTR